MKFGVALLGCGTVGTGVLRLLERNREEIFAKRGVQLEVIGVGVRDLSKPRPGVNAPITDELRGLVEDPSVHIVIEAMGGVEPAKTLIQAAIRAKKHVVTANKELMAKHGHEIRELARENGVDVRMEAAVAAGIPVIGAIERLLGANRIERMEGVVNGTTNFILTEMAKTGRSFDDVLAEAQRIGFAEADPSSDVDGWDAAYKLCLLARVATGIHIPLERISVAGIRPVTIEMQSEAKAHGRVIKLIASLDVTQTPFVASVEPKSIPAEHPLASLEGGTNGILLQGDPVGELFWRGPGAGGDATASALMGDVVDIAAAVSLGERPVPRPWRNL